MNNPNLLILIVFAVVLAIGIATALAFGGSGDKQTSRRLERIKERHGTGSSAAAQAKAKRLRTTENDSGLAAVLRNFVPRPAELRQRLASTGREITIGQYAVLCAVILVITLAIALFLLDLPLFLALTLGFIVGVGGPHIVVGKMIQRRINAFTNQFPDAIDLIVRGLRSGLPVAQSMQAAGVEFPDPVGAEFRAISDKIKIGKSMESALWEAALKIPTPDFKFFVITLAIQRETGGNLAETLGNLSDILRKRQQLKLKVRAMSSEGRASAYIVGSLPFIMFGLILLLNYDYGIILVTDPRAMTAGIGGLIWMSIGAFIMAKMINFEV